MLRDRLGMSPSRVAALAFGTTLNPLNSSMIAVALVSLQHDFRVSVATSTWLVSGFYVAAAVAQPLTGRLVDQFGARRLFLAGLLIVLVSSGLAPLAPGFWWLVGLRVLQAVGTSSAFPSALVLLRAGTSDGGTPTTSLGTLTVASSVSAALGPVLGGVLVALAGWPAVFLVNVPLTAAGFVLALRVLPHAPAQHVHRDRRWRELDLPGVALFTATVTSLLVFLLSFAHGARWWLVAVFSLAGVLFVLRERAFRTPFLDVRDLAANRPLTSVLVQQGAVNLVFYSTFFGLPLWLEVVRGYSPDLSGVLLLPIAGLGVLTVPLASRLIRRHDPRRALIVGSVIMLASTGVVQLLGDHSTLLPLVALTVLLGVTNGFNNMGLQTALYESAPAARTGSAGGLFQTFRYLGAILATSVLGVVFERDLTSGGLHHVGYVMTAGAALVVALAVLVRRPVTR